MSDNLEKISTNDKIIVLFKEVGKEAVLKRIENKEKLIGGKFKVKKYGDVLLCYREDAHNLMPNITIYSDTYNGNIFFTGIDNFSNLISLTKEQCLTLFKELKNTSFNYKENDDGKMTLITQKTKEKKARVKMKVNWDDVPIGTEIFGTDIKVIERFDIKSLSFLLSKGKLALASNIYIRCKIFTAINLKK